MAYLDGIRSVFPDGIDQIREMFNLPAGQKNNLKRYQELCLKENLSSAEANELNSLTLILQDYIVDVEVWNLFGDILINMEKFLMQLKDDYSELSFKGEWDGSEDYKAKNIITYQGEGYIAKVDSKNKVPTNTQYWCKISAKGDKGEPGTSLKILGTYTDLNELNTAHPDGSEYDGGFMVGTHYYYWDPDTNAWADAGELKGAKGDKGDAGTTTWVGITDKPTTFPPSAHSHPKSEVGLGNVDNVKQMPITGGTFTGKTVAKSDANLATAQIQNVIISTANANISNMPVGCIWFKVE